MAGKSKINLEIFKSDLVRWWEEDLIFLRIIFAILSNL
jgi:hypothetical protein